MICLIPARGGSTRIPHKNIKDFHGKPIIAYSIETALDSHLFSKIIVSSDNQETLQIAEEYGALGLLRAPEYAADEIGTQMVAKHVLTRIRHSPYEDGDHFICVLYATAPLITPEDLQIGFKSLIHFGFSYTMSTSREMDCGSFYFGFTHAFLSNIPLYGNAFHIPVKDIDINTPEDWAKAEQMYEEIHGH